MDILNNRAEKPEINYPCQWTYKVIGLNEELVKQAVAEVCQGKVHTLKHSMNSSQGKYVSFSLIIVVSSDEERRSFFDSLKSHENLKMVL